MLVVITGVSGTGKTTLGMGLSAGLGLPSRQEVKAIQVMGSLL